MLTGSWHRTKALAAVSIAAILLSALTTVIWSQDAAARRELIQRFRSRGHTASLFISAYLMDIAKREAALASQRLAGPEPSREEFDELVESFDFQAAVLLDSSGSLLHVFPSDDDLLGRDLAAQYDHLSNAVAGRVAISGVVPSAARRVPVVAVAAPYQTPFGRRVFSGAFIIGESPLEQFLDNILPFTADVYLVDSAGRIAAGTSRQDFEILERRDPPLFRAVDSSWGGSYTKGGERHVAVAEAVPGTNWRLIMSVPEARLFRPLEGLRWAPWLVWAGMMTASALAIVLLIRLWQHEAQLSRQGQELQAQLEEQVRLNRALDEFSSRVAHDLRNPLGNVLAAAQMAARYKGDEKMYQKWLDMVQDQVRRGLDLVKGLLELAQAAGTPKKQSVDLNALVRELAGEAQGVQVEASDLPSIAADRTALRQALANLIQNAGLYARNNGSAHVQVRVEQEPAFWTITVEDEGPGLDPEEAATLFKPFERGRTQRLSGTGLGLAIVATTAKAHGGRAWYEPRPGGGSRFRFSIAQTPGLADSPPDGEKEQ